MHRVSPLSQKDFPVCRVRGKPSAEQQPTAATLEAGPRMMSTCLNQLNYEPIKIKLIINLNQLNQLNQSIESINQSNQLNQIIYELVTLSSKRLLYTCFELTSGICKKCCVKSCEDNNSCIGVHSSDIWQVNGTVIQTD